MQPTIERLLCWTSRILALLFAAVVSVFALDVFGEGYTFLQTILALTMHLIPTALVPGLPRPRLTMGLGWRDRVPRPRGNSCGDRVGATRLVWLPRDRRTVASAGSPLCDRLVVHGGPDEFGRSQQLVTHGPYVLGPLRYGGEAVR